MHFNYEEYTGIKFFLQWCVTINSTMTTLERGLVVGYLLLIIFYLFKGTKKERIFFAAQPITLVLVVLNPWSAWLGVKVFGISWQERFFRFFWLLPIVFTYTYFICGLYEKIKKEKMKKIFYVIMLGCAIIGSYQIVLGTKNTFTGVYENNGLRMVDNRYKIEDDTIEAAAIIQTDKEHKEDSVNVVYDSNMAMEIRAYDAAFISALETTYYYPITEQNQWMELVEDEEWIKLLGAMIGGGVADASWIDYNTFEMALEKLDVDYIILPKTNVYSNIWLQAGSVIGETPNYIVVKVIE